MVLYYWNLKTLSSLQDDKVTDDEIKMIQKKSGEKALRIFFPVLSVIMLIAIVYTLVCEKEFPIFYILVFAFLGLPMSIAFLKHKEICACYGTITDKTVRCARMRKSPVYLPYEKTKEMGTFKHKFTLSETVCEYFYCTVEINGQIYENICCQSKDFPIIDIGDRVIIAYDDIYLCPIVYKSSAKT